MIVLQPTSSEQTFTVLTRENDALDITLSVRKEGGSVIAVTLGTVTKSGSYLQVPVSASWENETFYQVRIYNGMEEVYRGLILITSDTDLQHSSIYDVSGEYIDV